MCMSVDLPRARAPMMATATRPRRSAGDTPRSIVHQSAAPMAAGLGERRLRRSGWNRRALLRRPRPLLRFCSRALLARAGHASDDLAPLAQPAFSACSGVGSIVAAVAQTHATATSATADRPRPAAMEAPRCATARQQSLHLLACSAMVPMCSSYIFSQHPAAC